MLTIEQKRQKILTIYPNWNEVYSMEDRQIAKIYQRLNESGRFRPGYQKKVSRPINSRQNYQYNLADWMVEKEKMG